MQKVSLEGEPTTLESGGRLILETIQTVLLALVLYLAIDTVVARVQVDKISMEPTLHAGEFILVNKLAYRFGSVERGDIIVFHYPLNPSEDYIKRVIGLPGDVVRVQNGNVYVNGQQLEEPYISAPPVYEGQWVVPDEKIFVLGDNRNQSSDSHEWGFVPYGNIVGRAMVIYWPLNDFRVLNESFVVSAAP